MNTVSESTVRRRAAEKGLYLMPLRGGISWAIVDERAHELLLEEDFRLELTLDEAARLIDEHETRAAELLA